MKLIIITSPDSIANEPEIINQLFAEGLSILHLRKPNMDIDTMRRFIFSIDKQYHIRIVLHDNYILSEEFDLKGIHLNDRNKGCINDSKVDINSSSLHSIEELKYISPNYKYVMLSPVFDSISKTASDELYIFY